MSLSAPASSEGAVTLLSYFDVVVVVLAAPILLLIGVPPVGYGAAAGAWLGLRAVGAGVEAYARRVNDAKREVIPRLAYMMGRVFLLALTVVFVRNGAGRAAGLTALLVIVAAFTINLVISFMTRPRRR